MDFIAHKDQFMKGTIIDMGAGLPFVVLLRRQQGATNKGQEYHS